MFVDPWGLAVTEWDKAHCTIQEQLELKNLTFAWQVASNAGDTAAMQRAHERAVKIRERYLESYESVTDDGGIRISIDKVDPVLLAAGVTVTNIRGIDYLDYTVPVKNALNNALNTFKAHKDPFWFRNQVNHNKVWDIKRPIPWKETIGLDFPGKGQFFVVNGYLVTPEALGNMTYGYLGAASGYTPNVIFMGGDYADNGVWGVITSSDSPFDKYWIAIGYAWYLNDYPG